MITGECNTNSSRRLTQKKFFEVVEKKEKMGEPFSCKDFPPEQRDSFRQMVLRMKRQDKIELLEKNSLCFYQRKGAKTWNVKRKFTTKGMEVGQNMDYIINEASRQIPQLHDMKINFLSSEIYENAKKIHKNINPKNAGIFLDKIPFDDGIYAKISIYPNSVVIDVASTRNPIAYDMQGTFELSSYLGVVYDYIITKYQAKDLLPLLEWRVTHYHINQDGQTEFKGKEFTRTLNDIFGGFVRVYAKKFPDGKRLRMERIITPNTVLKNVFSDMQKMGSFWHSGQEDISNIMPSQTLALNQFAKIILKMSLLWNPSSYGATFL